MIRGRVIFGTCQTVRRCFIPSISYSPYRIKSGTFKLFQTSNPSSRFFASSVEKNEKGPSHPATDLSGEEISSLICVIGEEDTDGNSPAYMKLASLAKQIKQYPKTVFDSQDISECFFGIHRFPYVSSPELLELVSALTVKLQLNESRFSTFDISKCLFGLQHMKGGPEVMNVLRLLDKEVGRCNGQYSTLEVSRCLFGLQNMDAAAPEHSRLLLTLSEKFRDCSDSEFSANEVNVALYSIRDWGSGALKMLDTILPFILNCTEDFSAQELSGSLYGLKSLDNMKMNEYYRDDGKLISELLQFFNGKIQRITTPYTPSDVSLSFTGLGQLKIVSDAKTAEDIAFNDTFKRLIGQLTEKITQIGDSSFRSNELVLLFASFSSMKSSEQVVVDLIHSLVPKVKHCPNAEFAPGEISAFLYGLKSMESSVEDVRELLVAAGRHFPPLAAGRWTAQDISLSLYGLQSMCSGDEEVQHLISYFAHQLEACSDKLTPQQLTRIFSALWNMSSDHAAVLHLLTVLGNAVTTSSIVFSASDVSSALFGIKGMTMTEPVVVEYLAALVPKAESSYGSFTDDEESVIRMIIHKMKDEMKQIQSLTGTEGATSPQLGRAIFVVCELERCFDLIVNRANKK